MIVCKRAQNAEHLCDTYPSYPKAVAAAPTLMQAEEWSHTIDTARLQVNLT